MKFLVSLKGSGEHFLTATALHRMGMLSHMVVENFGCILGPIASALLMSIRIAVLARQDLMGNNIGHLPLYVMGLATTYNLGRDNILLVVYPLVSGWILLSLINRRKTNQEAITF